MARRLFGEFSDLNAKLLEEAIDFKGVGSISSVSYVARIPGEIMIAFASGANLNENELSDLLGEKFSVVKPNEDFSKTVENVLGSDFNVDSYPLDFDTDDKKATRAIAAIPKNKVDATKFKLAQQIAGVPIIRR